MSQNSSHAYAFDASEGLGGIFEPDVIIPEEFIGTGKELRGGERRLMAAILSDGIESYIAHVATARPGRDEQVNDAWEWVHTKDYSYVFSFDNVCECLGIDPDYLRLGLVRYINAIREKRAQGDNPNKVWKKIRRPRK